MKVLKFGGTSLGTASRMKRVAQLIQGEKPCIVVLSAMSGTTNSLVNINDKLKHDHKREAKVLILDLEKQYHKVVDDLLKDTDLKGLAREKLLEVFDSLKSFTNTEYENQMEKEVLSKGETLSTSLFQLYLSEQRISSCLLSALTFMKINKDGEPDQTYIKENLNREVVANQAYDFIVTQGFICLNSRGDLDNLKRGGSDYTASLIGGAIEAEEIQIWTDIDGIHNNDPRYVKNTKALSAISFDEAAELAYFGAKILHPSSIAPAKLANVPVRLKNTMDPDASGTWIDKNKSGNGIKAIAAKDHITAININSSKMLMAHGFLHKVFEVFEKHETAVDMITTSEVAVSLTIDNTSKLGPIVEELSNYASVRTDGDLSIICVVGDFIAESKGYAFSVFKALQNIPIRMISFGGSQHNVSLLVKGEDKIEALQALHSELFDEE
jgi:aspartate kinase